MQCAQCGCAQDLEWANVRVVRPALSMLDHRDSVSP